jgi:hypothetical protein
MQGEARRLRAGGSGAFASGSACVISSGHFQPGTRPACSIHLRISGPCSSSRDFTLTYRVRSVLPSGGRESNYAPPKKTTFTETSYATISMIHPSSGNP